jgi:hypothetical protein
MSPWPGKRRRTPRVALEPAAELVQHHMSMTSKWQVARRVDERLVECLLTMGYPNHAVTSCDVGYQDGLGAYRANPCAQTLDAS